MVVYNSQDFTIWDYIVNPSTIWKLKKIAKAWNLIHEFEAATFDLTDHMGRLIGLKLVVDSQPGYSDKNSVKDYLANLQPASFQNYDPGVPDPKPAVGDEIPF